MSVEVVQNPNPHFYIVKSLADAEDSDQARYDVFGEMTLHL